GFTKNYKTSSQKTGSTYSNAFDYLASISNTLGSKVHLIKLNNKAEVTLRKSVNLSTFNEAVAVVKTPSNGYFIGGYTQDGSLLILKLDSNGNIIFTRTFGTDNNNIMQNLILLRDGGVLAIGSSVTTRSYNDNLFETGLGLKDIYISRFSKDGTKLWSKKYGTEYDDTGIDAVEANDGSIVVLSQTNYDKFKNITLMRVTQNGDKIWLKHYKNEKYVTPYKVIKLRDGNFIASLSQQDEIDKEQIRLIKFDLQRNILNDKIIHTTYSSALKDIKEYSDSKLIGVGYVKDTFNTDGLVMQLDNNLNMLRQEHYGDENYDVFNAVTILHNSQAAAVGVYTNNESQESNMWIVQLNRDISMMQIAPNSASMYKKLTEVFKEEIANKSITIKEDLSISFIDESLYFKTGQYELNSEQKIFLQDFSKKLLPLLHVNKEHINTLEVSGHTSSEWGTTDFTNSFLKNEKLSMNRSYSTLAFIFKNQDSITKEWLSNVVKGSGLGFSKKQMFNEKEDREKSRRVSFKIILK
ncbi:MAG: hypothetical protein OQJ82_08110, partial [Sulfurimonas sp.]|nr:hypothetical protein [Sulfurimonas sp.]